MNVSQATQEAVDMQIKMMQATTSTHAYSMLVNCRPTEKDKFSGDTDDIDFDSYLAKLLKTFQSHEVADIAKYSELTNWFTGSAKGICEIYHKEDDAKEGFNKAIRHLREAYGRKHFSPQILLSKYLSGPKITPDQDKKFLALIVGIEKTYNMASPVHQAKFENSEIIHTILRDKLQFLYGKYSHACNKRIEKLDPMVAANTDTEMTFVEFINFLKSQQRILQFRNSVAGENKHGRSAKVAMLSYDSDSEDDFYSAAIAAADNTHQNRSRSYSTSSNARSPSPGQKRVSFGDRGWSCYTCDSTVHHYLDKCENFLSMSIPDRINSIRRKQGCTNCFGRHSAKDCPKREHLLCLKCNKPHNTLLHLELEEK